MKILPGTFCILFVISVTGCTTTQHDKVNLEKQSQIQEQFAKLNDLLRDSSFATELAKEQESAYYISQGQVAPSLPGKDSFRQKSFKEEKTAINLAGFYATECGINALIEAKGQTPVYWLNKIVKNELDSAGKLLLNRFANATWKAGQPFRSLSRITKDNFVVANFLSEDEIKKDWNQIVATASVLLDSLKDTDTSSTDLQMKKMGELLKDKQFALKMAMHIDSSYYAGEKKAIPPFVTTAEDSSMINKSAFEEKIAINIAGFYALECGINYIATAENKPPFDILTSIINDSISQKDKRLLERFANATWKAGQPFRSLDRITRGIFVPFSFLPNDEIEKDWVQIKSAASKIAEKLHL